MNRLIFLIFLTGFTTGSLFSQSFNYLPDKYLLVQGTDTLDFPFLGGLNAPRIQWVTPPDSLSQNLFILDQGEFFWFSSPTNDLEFKQPTFSGQINSWFLLEDINDDGFFDLVTTDSLSQVVWFRGAGPAFQFSKTKEILPTSTGEPIITDGLSQPDFYDIDGDGDADFFSGLPFGSVLFYENTGTTKNPLFTYQTDRFGGILVLQDTVLIDNTGLRKPLHGASSVTLFDYESDGDTDLFFGDFFSRSVYRFDNSSSDPLLPRFTWNPNPFPDSDPVITDGYNQVIFHSIDTMQQLFVTSNITTSSVDNFWHYINDGSVLQPDYQLQTKNFLRSIDLGRRSGVSISDLNGDGLADLLAGSDAGFLNAWYWQADSSFRFQSGKFAFSSAIPGCHPSIIDDDGDGKPDLFVGSFDGTIRFFRNIGLPTVPVFSETPSRAPQFDAGSYSIPFAHDLNLDGITDLLIGSSNGRIFLVQGASGNRWSAPDTLVNTGQFRSVAPFVLFWDEDSIPDLLVSEDNGSIQIYRGILSGTSYEIDSVLTSFSVPVQGLTVALLRKVSDRTIEITGGCFRGGIVSFQVQLPDDQEPPPDVNDQLFLYPNPSNHFVIFKLPYSGPFSGSIFSITGQCIRQFSDSGSAFRLETKSLATGIYLFSIHLSGKMYYGKFLVIH